MLTGLLSMIYKWKGCVIMKDLEIKTRPQMREKDEEKSLKVAIAESERDKKSIYRLRYRVYVEEMGRQIASADHKQRLVIDDLDAWGFLVYVKLGPKIIGTIRNNLGGQDAFSPALVQMFSMDKFTSFNRGKQGQKFCFTSKYVVVPDYRRTSAAYMLVAGSYEFWRDEGKIQFVFAGCNPSMVPLYERLGFRRFTNNVEIPEYGCMVPLVWLVEDEAHMRAVGSPFYRNARKRRNDQSAADWFVREFPTAARFVNSRLVSADGIWRIVGERLGRSPLQAVPVLTGLTEEEAKKFLHIGLIHRYNEGEKIINPGDYAHEMHILLSGNLIISSPTHNHPLETLRIKPGDFCGRVALLESGDQTSEATAATDVELFIVSGMAFTAFLRSHPVVAQKVLHNIGVMTDTVKERKRLG